jgi:hypothetical protein
MTIRTALDRTRRHALAIAASCGLVAASGALVLATAGGASAAPLPAPVFHPQTFYIQINTNGHGFGQANGPVRGDFAYAATSATNSVLAFRDGSVDVTHTNGGGNLNLNPRTCFGFEFEQGAWWLHGLAGDDAFAVGNGHYDAWTWAWGTRERNGRCGPPVSTVTIVWAWGHAANPRLVRTPPPAPKPVPTKTSLTAAA